MIASSEILLSRLHLGNAAMLEARSGLIGQVVNCSKQWNMTVAIRFQQVILPLSDSCLAMSVTGHRKLSKEDLAELYGSSLDPRRSSQIDQSSQQGCFPI